MAATIVREMAKSWCRHEDCQQPQEGLLSKRPLFCPECGKHAAWATQPGVGLIPAPKPIDGWKVSENDRKFLRSLRINPEV
jgi:hypothetical protein